MHTVQQYNRTGWSTEGSAVRVHWSPIHCSTTARHITRKRREKPCYRSAAICSASLIFNLKEEHGIFPWNLDFLPGRLDCHITSYNLFSFRKSVQDYTIHMDREIVIFIGIKGWHQHKCVQQSHVYLVW